MMIETSILSALQLNICTKEESIFPGTFGGKIRKNGASSFLWGNTESKKIKLSMLIINDIVMLIITVLKIQVPI